MLLMPSKRAMVALQRGRTMLVASIVRLVNDRRHGRATRLVVRLTEWAIALAISSAGAGAVQWYDFWKRNQAPTIAEFA